MSLLSKNLIPRVKPPVQKPEGRSVLCYSEAWGQGGIETFLMALFRRYQGKGFSFTLFSCWDWNMAFDEELSALGIDRYTVFPDNKPGQVKRLKEGISAFGELIDEVHPNAVYVNTMNGMGFSYTKVAKRKGVPVRVAHSHNSTFGSGQAAAKAVMHSFGKGVLGSSATVRLACSCDAGNYLFGNRPFTVVNNGIDTKRYTYDNAARIEIRSDLGVPQDSLLFGSVGRIAEAKNPFFQIRAFAEIFCMEPSSYYLMAGDGEMRSQVEAFVGELGLKDRVIMPGYLPDTTVAYSALDCLLMPSFFEGFPITCIEAQCAGCPLLCSEALPPEAHLTDVEVLMPLSAGEKGWAEKAIEVARRNHDRADYASLVREAGFDADDTTQQVASVLEGGCVD